MPYIAQLAIVHYSILAAALAVCLYLFLSIKRDLHTLDSRTLRRGESVRERLDALAGEIETLRQEVERMDQAANPSATISRTLGSSTRIQAMRMIKQGGSSEEIAAALSLPRSEVELMLKIQKLTAEESLHPTS